MVLERALGVLEAKKTLWPAEELRDIVFGVRFYGAFVHRESGDAVRKGIESIIPEDWKKEVIILNPTAIAIFRFLVERAGNQYIEQAKAFVKGLPRGEPLVYDYQGRSVTRGEPGVTINLPA
ncbi:MAG: hypothetical protein Q7S60_03700 [bacterium]|nr:hypothetical protein [bacterium]